MTRFEKLKALISELIEAIETNTETTNMPLENGQDNYEPIVKKQYMADELEALKTFLAFLNSVI